MTADPYARRMGATGRPSSVADKPDTTRLRTGSFHRCEHMSRTEAGFTLVELMITVAVVAILAAIAFPSFQATIRSNRIATRTNEFMASVALARAEAVKNNIGAGMCASANGATCDTVNTGLEWNDGWIVFDDVNGNKQFDAGDRVVRVTPASKGLLLESMINLNPVDTLMFNARGIFVYGGGGAAPATVPFDLMPYPLSDCPSGYQGLRNFNLNISGQLSVTKAVCP